MNMMFQIPIDIIKNYGSGFPLLRHFKERHSKKRKDFISDVERPFIIFEQMLTRCQNNFDLKNKVVLEIGHGNSLAIGLLFLAYGAKKVYLIDRFKHLFWDEQDIAYHKKIFEQIENKNLPFASTALTALTFSGRGKSMDFDHDKIEICIGDAAQLPFENNSIDNIFSNAVLEHIHNINKAISEFSRVTKKDGYGVHEVDLRDHFIMREPLQLLQWPEWLWNMMYKKRPGYTNRLRYSDYIKMFEQVGFNEIRHLIIEKYEGDIKQLKLNKKFTFYTENELRVLAFWVMLKKGRNN